MALKLGLTPQTYARYEKGERTLPDEVKIQLHELGVNLNWLLTGEGAMFNGTLPGEIGVESDGLLCFPILKETLCSGDLHDVNNVESFVKPLCLITQNPAAQIFAVHQRDWQMCGVGISMGDTVFFDATTKDARTDNIFCIALNGKVFCKWLCFGQNDVRLYSVDTNALNDKQVFGTYLNNSDGFLVLGRVVAWLHKNHIIYHQ